MNPPNLRHLTLLTATLLLASCGTARKVGDGAAWTYKKTVSGVKGTGSLVAKGAKKLWPFGGSDETPAAATAQKKSPTQPPVAPLATETPRVVNFDPAKRWVTDAILGAEKRVEENSLVTLKEGWEISGSRISFVSATVGEPPTLVRAEGSPARAKLTADGRTQTVQAKEIHYRQDPGILVLKGNPSAQVGINKISGNSPNTIIMLNLVDGTFKADGPIKSGY